MAQQKLFPGFRFHPTDVELVMYYLKRKVMGRKFSLDIIAEIDIYKYFPWDLPAMSLLQTGDLEWFFFCPRGKKYFSGARVNRATDGGYWKTTGKDRSVKYNGRVVAMIKTLVYHIGKAPKGDRTDWVMHEFRLVDKDLADKGIPQDSYVICKVFQKEGPGPRNGAQYGKPFNEEDWDVEEEIDHVNSTPFVAISALPPSQPSTSHITVANDMHPSSSEFPGLNSVSCLSGFMPSCSTPPSAELAPSNQVGGDGILTILDSFKEDDNSLVVNENNRVEVDNPGQANDAIAEPIPFFDVNEIFGDLEDLDSLDGFEFDDFTRCQENKYTTNEMFSVDDYLGAHDSHDDFLELIDLDAPLLWQTKPGS